MSHQPEAFFMFLAIIICVARLAGVLAARLGQARVVGEIVAGMAIVPTLGLLLGPELRTSLVSGSAPYMTVFGEFGLVLLMLKAGLSFETDHLRHRTSRSTTLAVAISGLVVPFLLGAAIGWWSADDLASGFPVAPYVVFCGIALSVSAMPVLVRIAQELGIERTPACAIAIGAAAATDVFGWVALAAIAALAAGPEEAGGVAASRLASLAVFLLAAAFVIRPGVHALMRRLPDEGEWASEHRLGVAVSLALGLAVWTSAIGLHSAFGAFVAGVVLKVDRRIAEVWDQAADGFVGVTLVAVFFAASGTKLDFTSVGFGDLGLWFGAFFVAALVGKLGGCYVAGRLSGMRRGDAVVVAALLNTRGLMEIVFLTVALQLGVIPVAVFSILVAAAILTTLMTMPLLRAWRRHEARTATDAPREEMLGTVPGSAAR